MNTIHKTKNSRYDAAVFYTGGKDSSYLLYYLSSVLGLRVLSLTWLTPYMSDNALLSIANAKIMLPNVDFIIKEAPKDELSKIYKKAFQLQQNTCICPSVAYILFYPLLVELGMPYLVLGNEPVQCKSLIYNKLAPAAVFRPWVQKTIRFLVNAGRIAMLKKPLKTGSLEMYAVVKNLSAGDSRFLTWLRHGNAPTINTVKALAEAPAFLSDFKDTVTLSWKNGKIPAMVHVDLADIGGGIYDWNAIKEMLKIKMNWGDAPICGKSLNTSCTVERCKEYTQLLRYQNMQTNIIPFSALEISLAVQEGCISREQAIYELKTHSGFTENEPYEMQIMRNAFIEKKEEL